MPNTIKYSTTGDTLSLKKGNFYIGVGDVGKGATFQTGHWNGYDVPAGGYTIYENKTSNGPSIRVSNNSTELIDVSNRLYSGTSITTEGGALNYLNGLSTVLCVNRDYEPIITDGLVLNMDAGYSPSYRVTGSSWYDVSLNGATGTLFNTPTYSNTSGGYLSFSNSSSQYATVPNIGTISNWTAEVWVRFTSSLNGQISMVLGNQFNLTTSINFTIGTNSAPGSYNIVVGFFQNGWQNTTGFSPTLNTWYQIVGTYNGSVIRQYVNGVPSGGTKNVTATLQSGGEIRIMRRWDDVVSSGNLFNGDLSIARVYNRALNDSEILNNFDSQKSRFGL